MFVSAQPCFGGVGPVQLTTSNGGVELRAQGPSGTVDVHADLGIRVLAERGVVNVKASEGFSAEVLGTAVSDGGQILMSAGPTSQSNAAGGQLAIAAGGGTNAVGGAGGKVTIDSGSGSGGSGGEIKLLTGAGSGGRGGDFVVGIGSGDSGAGGAVSITAGDTSDGASVGGSASLSGEKAANLTDRWGLGE